MIFSFNMKFEMNLQLHGNKCFEKKAAIVTTVFSAIAKNVKSINQNQKVSIKILRWVNMFCHFAFLI